MLDRLPHELEIGVGQQRNLLDAVDTIDPGTDAQHREVPIHIDQVFEADGGEGHVVGIEGRRWGVGGEEFNVERIGGVDWDHSFRIVVQILEQYFAQGVDFAAARSGDAAVAREELALLLERAE